MMTQAIARSIPRLRARLGLPLLAVVLDAVCMTHPASVRADTTPPTVTINPLSSAVVGGVLQILIAASDDVGVTSVSLLVDGASIGTDLTAPYFVDWNTTAGTNGPHTLVALALDSSGNLGVSDPVPLTVQNPAFANQVVVPGITWGLTVGFLPDGRMLVGELLEKIWVVHPGSTIPEPKPFLALDPPFGGEQGLHEILIDPDFATNHWYYVFYTHAGSLGDDHDRVSRFTASGDTTLAGSEVVLWEDDQVASSGHHGSGLVIGPGGKLFIAIGDQGVADDAQRLDRYRGKLLRVNLDGSIPTDNPFYDGAGSNHDEIWAYGLRNPTRIFYDAASGRLFVADVGGNASDSKEEINLGEAGANYGWPLCEGACGIPGQTDPLYWYPHLGRDASITGGFVYHGGSFPSEYEGSYFFGDYAQNWIKRLTFDTSGALLGAVDFEPPDGANDGPYGDVVKLLQGPDGSVYYVDIGVDVRSDLNGAAVRRIVYTPGDLPPEALASATPASGLAPLDVNFSSAGSSDPEGLPLSYDWDFGDGSSSIEANPVHTYTAEGMYTVRLRVSDGNLWTFASALVISVGPVPTATILTPADGALFRAGDVIGYSGTGTDGSGSPLPAGAYTWEILFHHDSHIHPEGGPIPGITSGAFTVPASGHDFSGYTRYEVILTVTDSNGLRSSSSVFVFPDKVNLTFTSAPPGLGIDVDGIRRQTPSVIDALKGFHYSIAAPDQIAEGWLYHFLSWSDSGVETHDIAVPEADSIWVASFTASPVLQNLVAAYSFEEGTGTTTADRSGRGHTGTLDGAVWTTQGRYGGALGFNGLSSSVTVPDSPLLQLSSAMTLEAWVYPEGATGGWRDVIMKSGDDYYLAANSGTPAVGSSISGPLYHFLAISPQLWSHLAATFDGSTLRLYVNGFEVNSRALTGPLAASGGPLSLGGDALFGQYFSGRIDEVRIYARALSRAEILNDMSAPITAVEPAPPGAGTFVRAAPNPFSPSTRIRFHLGSAATPSLRIFDVSGRLVREFRLPLLPPGDHAVLWDGTGEGGARVGSGVYLVRLESPDGAHTLRVVLVR